MAVGNKLTFGYLYDFRNPAAWHRPWTDLYAETLEFATWTETVGFEGAWVPEHHAADDGYQPSPMVTLAALAARTKRMRIGSAVALAPLYHPVRFAEECGADRTGGLRTRGGAHRRRAQLARQPKRIAGLVLDPVPRWRAV
jgi:hypothetical protein